MRSSPIGASVGERLVHRFRCNSEPDQLAYSCDPTLGRQRQEGRLRLRPVKDTQWHLVLEEDTQLCSAGLKDVAFELELETPMFCPVFSQVIKTSLLTPIPKEF